MEQTQEHQPSVKHSKKRKQQHEREKEKKKKPKKQKPTKQTKQTKQVKAPELFVQEIILGSTKGSTPKRQPLTLSQDQLSNTDQKQYAELKAFFTGNIYLREHVIPIIMQ